MRPEDNDLYQEGTLQKKDCIRVRLEQRERDMLYPAATLAAKSKGRRLAEPEDPYRTVFQRDRDRILHAKAFRRLKRKTQVFLAPQGDHYRTRLTHTLEVAQISRTVARALFLNEDLTEAIALGHDIGHTPFGHAGEDVLNELASTGFSHAAQSLRVVEKLEMRHGEVGLNLCEEVRDGIRYHSEGKALLRGEPMVHPSTLEGRIVSVCDAIAYVNHDIDDAIRAQVITLEDLPSSAIAVLGETTSSRIDKMAVGLIEGSKDGEIAFTPHVLTALNTLRDYLYSHLYPCPIIESEIAKARRLLRTLFLHLLENPTEEILNSDPADSLEQRTVDFVAGMTDDFALHLFERLLLPSPWKK